MVENRKFQTLDDGSVALNFSYDPVTLAKAKAKHEEVPGSSKYDNTAVQDLAKAFSYLKAGGLPTLKPLLPLLLALKGKPYNLERHFPFEPMFRTRVPKKSLWKAGRQLSKCGYFEDAVIRLANGKQVSIADLSIGDEVLSLYVDKFAPGRITNIWKSGLKPVLRIRTKLGADFEVTAEHRLLTAQGYRSAAKLTVGQRLVGVRRGGEFGKLVFREDKFHKYFTNDSRGISHDVFELNRRSLIAFLARLWKERGHVFSNDAITLIGCYLPSRSHARDVRAMLNKLGIPSVLSERENGFQVRVITEEGRADFLRTVLGKSRKRSEAGSRKATVYDEIISIEPAGEKETYDIEVFGPSNFVLDGVVSHNSTSMAAQALMQCNSIPHFSIFFLAPLYEMIRRFSQNYVRRFIEESPVKRLFVGKGTINSVLQKTFHNFSQMLFSFAYLDAERTRGISADANYIDEIQDLHWDFLDIIHETLSGSEDWGIIRYAGTPKSLDNTMEHLWIETSQAEWITKCPYGGCGHWNIPTLELDLLNMIGPARDDVSEKSPGTVCAKCRKPINPSTGRWYHFNKEQRWSFDGYHIPQIIMPMHYANPLKWATLVGKRDNTAPNVFFNEVCGESYDSGSKLVTLTELKEACCLKWKNVAEDAKKRAKGYKHVVVSADWGGNGGMVKVGKQKVQRVSFTVITALGLTTSGKVDVLWGHRVLRALDFDYEISIIASAMQTFRASHLVHDYGGAGDMREYVLLTAGFPPDRIIPVRYHGAASKNPMLLKPATDEHPRQWYSLDKSWSLGITCAAIRKGYVRFFEYDFQSAENPGLVHDFLALQEENVERKGLTDVHYITRNPTMPDDFAQAVNIGANALWYITDSWPELGNASDFKLDEVLMRQINPAVPTWDLGPAQVW